MPNKSSTRRHYRKNTRAKKEQQTRQKITEAVVELHRTVGPVKTTISDIADLAGVGRVTVYKHFPSETELFEACGEHWLSENPPPDFSVDLAIEDFKQKVFSVLQKLYTYYRTNRDMLGHILRDAQVLPALAEVVNRGWINFIRDLEERLLSSKLKASVNQQIRASIRVALDFNTWQILLEMKIDDQEAASLVTLWILAMEQVQ